MSSRSNVQSSKDHSECIIDLDHVARKHEHSETDQTVLILSYWHYRTECNFVKLHSQFITVSGVLIPVIHHFHNITIEGSTSGKHTVLAPSFLPNLLILSCPLKLLVSIAKVYTLYQMKAMNKGITSTNNISS